MADKNLFFDYGKSYIELGEINDLEAANFPEEVKWRPGEWLDNATGATPFNGTDISIPLAGNVGWLNDVSEIIKPSDKNITTLKEAAVKAGSESDIIVIAASGAFYAAAKAGVSFLARPSDKMAPDIVFIGWNTSSAYHNRIMKRLENVNFSLCVIEGDELAKETALAYAAARTLLEKQYGIAYAQRLYVFSCNEASALSKEAREISASYFLMEREFQSPWSALALSSLFPLAACGADIEAILKGAAVAEMPEMAIWTPVNCADGGIGKEDFIPRSSMNIKYYSALRNLLRKKDYGIEIIAYSDIRFKGLIDWIKSALTSVDSGNRGKLYVDSIDLVNQLDRLLAYTEPDKSDFFLTVLSFDDYAITNEESIGDMEMDIIGKDLITKTVRALRMKRTHILEVQVPESAEFFYGQLISLFLRSAKLTEIWK